MREHCRDCSWEEAPPRFQCKQALHTFHRCYTSCIFNDFSLIFHCIKVLQCVNAQFRLHFARPVLVLLHILELGSQDIACRFCVFPWITNVYMSKNYIMLLFISRSAAQWLHEKKESKVMLGQALHNTQEPSTMAQNTDKGYRRCRHASFNNEGSSCQQQNPTD